ncbi:hypothetical protein KEH51_19440 [[Brevibacterium] frigoritolerans]|uniref:Glycosyl hydrolase family 13 catalytic domain-containing protein n=1 Tax=Peribacillus frigoritolerans TaxID=450367 RepID=A0A941FL50_9BACI|nr:hypothetical protein [Peribacillus frigoritolerans]
MLSSWQYGMQEGNGWNALFWCNHDQPRIVSRFGNDQEYHNESAKMLATAIHMLREPLIFIKGGNRDDQPKSSMILDNTGMWNRLIIIIF